MAGDGTAILATRDMNLYQAPFATSNAFPADTVDFGTAWTAPWVDVGFTDGGIQVTISVDRADITVDQLLEPVLRPVTGRTITFTSTLAEATVDNLNLAAGLGTVASVAPGAGTKGHDTLEIGTDTADVLYSWGFEAKQQNGEPFRGAIFRGQATGSPAPTFGVADTKSAFDLEITALVDTSTTPDRIAEFRNVLPAA